MRTHADPAGFTVPLPEGWETVTPPAGALLVAREPADGERFRANLVVTRDDVGSMTLRDWQAGTDRLLPSALTDYALIDLELLEVAGHDGARRLAHHTAQTPAVGPQAVTMEQWAALVDGTGYTLTFTTPTLRHAQLRPTLLDVVVGWRLGAGGAG